MRLDAVDPRVHCILDDRFRCSKTIRELMVYLDQCVVTIGSNPTQSCVCEWLNALRDHGAKHLALDLRRPRDSKVRHLSVYHESICRLCEAREQRINRYTFLHDQSTSLTEWAICY
jgi:hypothetical protein